MTLGIDASTQLELDKTNPHYYYKGEEVEPWSFMRSHNNIEMMRLRLWVDPYDEEGRPYGGGTCDLKSFITLAKRALKLGYKVVLDFHYSDFWADPSKQSLPKAWRNLNFEELVEKVHSYTLETLLTVKKEGIPLFAVQVGNEITHGTLWPFGAINGNEHKDYDNLCTLLQSGATAVREIYPEAKIILHLEKSGDKVGHDEWYGNMVYHNVDFDVVGLSYYPYWHGTMKALEENIVNLRDKYHKEIWIVEAGYPFTWKPYGAADEKSILFVKEEQYKTYTGDPLPYPLDKKGQADYLRHLMSLSEGLGVKAICYWEPFWIPSTKVGWARVPGMLYEGKEPMAEDLNEWANQTLFDYEGEATPGLDAFKK